MSCCRYMYDVCWKCETFKVKEAVCFLYCLLLFISGVIFVFLATYWLYRAFYFYVFMPENTYGPLFLLVLLGIINPFLAWLGIGACQREHDFHIIMFMVFILISALIDIAIGIWTMMMWNDADVETQALIGKAFWELDNEGDHVRSWDRIQTYLECCGNTGKSDYITSKPNSCCEGGTEEGCTGFYEVGCLSPLRRFAERLYLSVAITYFFWAIFKICGMAVFIIYFNALKVIRKERRRRLLELEKQELDRRMAAEGVAPIGFSQVGLVNAEAKPHFVKPRAPEAPSQPPDVLPVNQPERGGGDQTLTRGGVAGNPDEITVVRGDTLPEERRLIDSGRSRHE